MDEPVGGRRWRIGLLAGVAVLAVGCAAGVWAMQRWGNSTTPLAVDDIVADRSAPATTLSSLGPTTTVVATVPGLTVLATSTSAASAPPLPPLAAEGV